MMFLKKKKIFCALLGILSIEVASADFIAGTTDESLAIGKYAGFTTNARCADGSVAFTVNPSDCAAKGGWLIAPNGVTTESGHAGLTINNLSGGLAQESVSLGFMNLALGSHSMAIGAGNLAAGNSAIVLGNYSVALNGGIAIGSQAISLGDGAVAIGLLSRATAGIESYTNAAQMNGATSNSYAEFSVGNATSAQYRRVTNVADGYSNNDATNVEQLNNGVTNAVNTSKGYTDGKVTTLSNKYDGALSSVASSLGGGAIYNPVTGTFTQPTYTVGGTNHNNVDSALSGTLTTANGYADAKNTALGNSTAASIGGGSAYNPATGAISNPTITAAGGTFTDTTSAIQALDASAVQYDKTAGGAVDTSGVTFQGVGGTTLHNVAAGVALTDAVNVGQLNSGLATLGTTINSKNDGALASVASSLGGGAIYNPVTGTFTQPTYTVGGTNHNNVGSALTAATDQTKELGNSTAASIGGGSVYDVVTGKINNPTITAAGGTFTDTTSAIQALDASAVQYDKTAGGAVDTSGVTFQGVGGTVLHNVKSGLAVTDGANYGQVQTAQTTAINTSTAYTDTKTAGILIDANTYADGAATKTLGAANNYTDLKVKNITLNSDNLGVTTAASIGGGSVYDPVTGKISNPTIAAAGGTFTDTTSAIQALDASAVQYDKTTDGAVDTSSVTFQGVGGTVLHNVASGVSPSDGANTQQVTDAQNNAIGVANAYTDGQVNNLGVQTQAQIASLGRQNDAQFKSLSNQIKATGSIASALSALIPNPHSASNWQAQAAVGYGSGAAAIGGGMTYQINNDTLVVGKIAVSTTGGVGMQNRVGMAVGVSLGL